MRTSSLRVASIALVAWSMTCAPAPLAPDQAEAAFREAKAVPEPGAAITTPAGVEERRKNAEKARLLEAIIITPDGTLSRVPITTDDFDTLAPANRGARPSVTGSQPSPQPADGANAPEEADPNDPAPEGIVGPDDRERVTATTAFPFRVIGRLAHGCTGALIGPRHVLTAGHCVFDARHRTWYPDLAFSPAQDGAARPFGEIEWTRAITVKGWYEDHLSSYDLGMVILAEDVGNALGWMGLRYQRSPIEHVVNLNGYPQDKAEGTLWHSDCPVDFSQEFKLHYECDTNHGTSGGAVYRFQRSSGQREILGVHAYGIAGDTGLNSAVRIQRSTYATLLKWLNEF